MHAGMLGGVNAAGILGPRCGGDGNLPTAMSACTAVNRGERGDGTGAAGLVCITVDAAAAVLVPVLGGTSAVVLGVGVACRDGAGDSESGLAVKASSPAPEEGPAPWALVVRVARVAWPVAMIVSRPTSSAAAVFRTNTQRLMARGRVARHCGSGGGLGAGGGMAAGTQGLRVA
ncbi:jg27360, partial [Pararge aegeria aegeria]